ncbi:MAG: amidase family protein, partial [Methylophilaceae bacterium]
MINNSINELHHGLLNKDFSSVELTEYFLSRIKKLNPSINAFITVDEEKSLGQAKLADEKISKGDLNPLTGIPIAQKDIFCAKGWKTTCGSLMLDNFISPYDAFVIEA